MEYQVKSYVREISNTYYTEVHTIHPASELIKRQQIDRVRFDIPCSTYSEAQRWVEYLAREHARMMQSTVDYMLKKMKS